MNLLFQVPIQLFRLTTKKKSALRFPCALVIQNIKNGESQKFAQFCFQRSLRAFLDIANSLRRKSPQSGPRELLLAKNFPGSYCRAASRTADRGQKSSTWETPWNWSSEPRDLGDWGCSFPLTQWGAFRVSPERPENQGSPTTCWKETERKGVAWDGGGEVSQSVEVTFFTPEVASPLKLEKL